MTAILNFVIPILHPQNAENWQVVKENLIETIRSVSGQDSNNWRAIIVANKEADLPDMPPKFEVKYVDFLPNPTFDVDKHDVEIFRSNLRLDKGRRLLSGMLLAKEKSTEDDYVMTVDGDDFISCRLASFVAKNPDSNGWYMPTGYFWDEKGYLLHKNHVFSRRCGTSHIIKIGLMSLPRSLDVADVDYIRSMLGSHIFIKDVLDKQGTPLEPLPFPGAVYRINHSASVTKTSGILRKLFFENGVLKSPKKTLVEISNIRYLNSSYKKEFWGY